MSKLQQLRAAVLAATTTPALEPDQLHTFIRDGRIKDTGAGLRYEGTAVVIVQDLIGSPHPIARALALWLRTNETEALDALQFEVDVIDHQKVDVRFDVPFSEAVVFDGGEFAACAAAVPDPDTFLPP
ncbi:phage tail protein [Hydrogenophaga electricum]|uniref:Phage tail protein n=1 Tax=Hydrogenophaga electricum TaxID=1230953 RepID=A0ABQ6C3L9_9BURK|nr:phage tail protein [Hydrogenophaga electricum]GLS13589.1 hypothetical protein GCM10007935_10190 [Hydrogenophaga electricum]